MKSYKTRSGRLIFLSALWAALLCAGLVCRAQDAAADKAWKQVVKASQPPFPPAEWQTNAPTPEQMTAFYAPYLVKAADMAKDFYTKYPEHPKAADARTKE